MLGNHLKIVVNAKKIFWGARKYHTGFAAFLEVHLYLLKADIVS